MSSSPTRDTAARTYSKRFGPSRPSRTIWSGCSDLDPRCRLAVHDPAGEQLLERDAARRLPVVVFGRARSFAEGPLALVDRHPAARAFGRAVTLGHAHERDHRRHRRAGAANPVPALGRSPDVRSCVWPQLQAGAGEVTRARRTCESPAAAKRDRPTTSAIVPGATSSTPPTTRRPRSIQFAGRSRYPPTPATSAMMPTAAETDATTASGIPTPVQRIARPSGCVNMNGTRKQGSAYFHVSIIVLYGLPPVIAAAANGESATGGETSDSTA